MMHGQKNIKSRV